MNDISSANLLSKIRELNAQLDGVGSAAPAEVDGPNFSSLLSKSINAVNDAQQTAGAQAAAYEAGDPGADLTQVMISLQKASLSFQAMTEVRNKLVNAYQEVMNMPV
ncbi:MAG: flagellar hook-basal body complex protein FliE [Pseudomonadota bacterium]